MIDGRLTVKKSKLGWTNPKCGSGHRASKTFRCPKIMLSVCVKMFVVLMRVFKFFARFMVMFVAMGVSRMHMLMVVHFPIMHMGVFMADVRMSVFMLMRNFFHVCYLLHFILFFIIYAVMWEILYGKL
jgi:hypothetical protein